MAALASLPDTAGWRVFEEWALEEGRRVLEELLLLPPNDDRAYMCKGALHMLVKLLSYPHNPRAVVFEEE